MSDGQRSVVVAPGDGTTIEGPVGGPLTFKVRGDETGDALTAFENVIPPREGPPMHVHAHEDESWYVLEGELRFSLDGELAAAPTGTFVFVPPGHSALLPERRRRARPDPRALHTVRHGALLRAVRGASGRTVRPGIVPHGRPRGGDGRR